MEDDTTMAQEDQTSNGGGGNGGVLSRSSKKSKQKKIPQRGLGVAQLEKIIEEQHKRSDGAVILPSQNSVSSTISSYLPNPTNNFNHSNQPSSTSIPLPSITPHLDVKVPSSTGQFEAGWPNVPKLWSSRHEIDFEKEGFGVEPLSFLPSLPFEPNPNWVQGTPQYHQPSSPMVNISSGTPSTPMPHLAIEPPSNQNYSSSGVPARPGEKAVAMKRPYPFSLDFPNAPAFNYKLSASAEISKNVKTSCKSESGFHFDAGNSASREVQSSSASKSEPNSKKRNKGIKDFDGHFLTLATPNPIPYPPSSYQENIEDQFPTPPGYRLLNQQNKPVYSFFLPAAKEAQIVQTTAAKIQNCHEVGESVVDLNLKL